MLLLRSAFFNLAFYLVTALVLLLGLPLLLAPRKWAMEGIYKLVARIDLWLLKHIARIDLDVRHREKLLSGPVIVASKHQSAWDTFGLAPLLTYPLVILKSDLMWLPLLGWYAKKFGHIPVKRGKGAATMQKLLASAQKQLSGKKELMIFPEGTRKPPGADPSYKTGIYRLYQNLGLPVVPVALNSGLYWPRRTFLRYPGTVLVEFLDPIMPGLSREQFMKTLEQRIENATRKLVAEALQDNRQLPVPDTPKTGTFPSRD